MKRTRELIQNANHEIKLSDDEGWFEELYNEAEEYKEHQACYKRTAPKSKKD